MAVCRSVFLLVLNDASARADIGPNTNRRELESVAIGYDCAAGMLCRIDQPAGLASENII